MRLCKIIFILIFSILIGNELFAVVKSEKRGIAYGSNSEADLEAISGGVSWWYNWYVEPEKTVYENYENFNMDFVPMVWGGGSDTSRLRKFLKIHPDVKYILGFNEPNFKKQSNMTPAQAAANWPKIEELADEFNLEIVSPAVNYCDQCVDIPGTTSDSDPVAYLDAFFSACNDCRVDYIGVHNYMCYAGALADDINRFKKYGKKIWLTEFACWDQTTITLDMQKSLVIGAIDYLENDTMIYRYSWFNDDRTVKWPFLNIYGPKPGELTELGQLYVGFYPVHDENIYFDIPARIEAENYSSMSGIAIEGTKDYDGMANVGWFDGGDWLQFNINVPETGEYYLYLRISSNSNTSVDLIENDSILVSYNIPSSGGWQNWRNYMQPLTLTKGNHKLKLYSSTGSLNVNWIAFKNMLNTPPTVIANEDLQINLPENSVILNSTVTDNEGDSLNYKWTLLSGNNQCAIQTPEKPSTEITGLTKGSYSFKVTVSDGIETASDIVKVAVDYGVGIPSLENHKFEISPNSATDRIIINEIADEIIIYNCQGGKIKEINIQGNIISITDLPRGIYFIKLFKDHSQIGTTRFLKN